MYITYLPACTYRTTTTIIAAPITPMLVLKSGWNTTYNTISRPSVLSPHPRSPGTVQRRYEIQATEYHRTATHRYSTLACHRSSPAEGSTQLQQLPTLTYRPTLRAPAGQLDILWTPREGSLRCTVRRRADLHEGRAHGPSRIASLRRASSANSIDR